GEVERHKLAVLDADHGAAAALEQEADGRVAQFAAVMLIERNRVATAQFITDVLVGHNQLDLALTEAALELDLDLARQINFGEADVAVFIALHVLQIGQFVRIELVNQPFGQHGDAVKAIFRAAFDDRAFDDVAEFGERNDLLAKFFADDRQGRA